MKHVDRWANSAGTTNAYPPYNIESVGENHYIVTLAIAGFTKDELNIETKEGELIIEGKKPPYDEEYVEPKYLHKGIATRDFALKFTLADYVEVKSANVNAGLLTIELERLLPEALKPRTIKIK